MKKESSESLGLIGEFLLAAGNFCSLLREESLSPRLFSERLLKVGTILYLKGVELSLQEDLPDPVWLPNYVTEQEYTKIAQSIAARYGQKDFFLESMSEEMRFTDSPITARISSFLADIYQPVADFLAVALEMPDQLREATAVCIAFFKEYWGDRLLAILRAVHSLFYNDEEELEEVSETEQSYIGRCGLDAYFDDYE